MPSVGPSVGLIAVVAFLLPGLAAVKLTLYFDSRGNWLNKTDTVAFSFGISLLSILIVYTVNYLAHYCFIFGLNITKFQDLVEKLDHMPTTISLYLQILFISVLIGTFIGHHERATSLLRPNTPWEKFHDYAQNEVDSDVPAVRVKTQNNDEIIGRIKERGEATAGQNIILEDPRLLRYNQGGETVEDRSWSGESYINNHSVTHVEFDLLDDPDQSVAGTGSANNQATLDGYPEQDSKEREELQELANEDESDVDSDN